MGNLAVCACVVWMTRRNAISCRMRPQWASSTYINKTPFSKLVVYRGVIKGVILWAADGNY